MAGPRAARNLLDDIDLLVDHLGRARPGRLDACFDDSHGTTARPVGVADPPRVAGKRTKAAFIQHLADIAGRASRAVQAQGTAAKATADLAFLILARDFLATLAQPATVDTIRLTRAYVEMRPPEKPRGSNGAGPPTGGSGKHAIICVALVTRMASLRKLCLVSVVVTLLISLYAFSGKCPASAPMRQNRVVEERRRHCWRSRLSRGKGGEA
jgi:hypothetical protein